MKGLSSIYNESVDECIDRINEDADFETVLKEDVSSAVQTTLQGIKNLYKTKDKNLVNGVPQLGKMITRVAVALTAATVVSVVTPLSAPLLSVIGLYTSHAIKSKNDKERRSQLIRMYSTKIEMIEEKMQGEEDSKAKYELAKVRDKLKSDSEKLKLINDKESE